MVDDLADARDRMATLQLKLVLNEGLHMGAGAHLVGLGIWRLQFRFDPRAPIQEVPEPPKRFFEEVSSHGTATKIDLGASEWRIPGQRMKNFCYCGNVGCSLSFRPNVLRSPAITFVFWQASTLRMMEVLQLSLNQVGDGAILIHRGSWRLRNLDESNLTAGLGCAS